MSKPSSKSSRTFQLSETVKLSDSNAQFEKNKKDNPDREDVFNEQNQELFARLLEKIKTEPFFILAIEGEIGAGKSTLAENLQIFLNQQGLNAQIVSMDNYYYPRAQKREKYEGNCDLDRIKKEVLIPFKAAGSYQTARFDPALQSLEKRQEYKGDVLILEGNYSLHPKIKDYIDFSLFLAIDPAKQLIRLQQRDPDKIEAFLLRWIPQSHAYFEHYQIQEKADLVLDLQREKEKAEKST